MTGRSDVTISPSTFPKREITKECPHKNEIVDIVIDMVEDLVEEKDFRVRNLNTINETVTLTSGAMFRKTLSKINSVKC